MNKFYEGFSKYIVEIFAYRAIFLNVIGLWIVLILVGFSGLTMYAYYAGCDPYTKRWVVAADQLMPYFVLEILHDYPGLPGLYVCAAFSGTLRLEYYMLMIFTACS